MGLETVNAIMDASDWGEMTAEGIQALCLASAPWNPILRHPWFRRVYLVFFVLSTLLVLLPYWTLLYLPKSNRPRKSWTLKRCLRVRWGRRICSVVAKCEIDYLGRDLSHQMDPLKLTHSHPIVIPPAPQSYIVGHPKDMLEKLHDSLDNWQTHFIHPRRDKYASKSDISYNVAPVTGFWFIGMKATPESPLILPTEDEPVMLHFHGGGYLCGTAAETDLTSNIPKTLVDHSPIKHVLSVDYRLSPTGPWPLPLIDAISAYHYLVNEVKVKERDIIIGGDSAGGHLALALTRWIRDEGAKLNLEGPRGLALLSPWTDLGFSSYWGPEAFANNISTDVIDSTFGPFASSLLCRALPLETTHHDPYLSPSSLFITPEATGPRSMESFPSTFLVYGDAEVLSLPIVDLWKRLELSRQSANPGQFDDELIAMPDSVHDFVIFPWQAEEASIVYSKLDEWLRTVLAKGDDGDDEDTKEQVSQEQQQRDSQWAMEQKIREQRRKRRESRQSLRITKSPVLQPRKERGVMRMVGDWSEEGLSIIDSPSLELDSFSLPSAETTREMLSPFTSQMEKGDWDIEGDVDGDGLDWFEGGGDVSEGESDDVEPRKDR